MTALAAIGWTFAAAWFVFWLIEHIGGREQRDELRDDLDKANARANRLGMRHLLTAIELEAVRSELDKARAQIHPSTRPVVVSMTKRTERRS